MATLSLENVEDITWLRLEQQHSGHEKWYRTIDIVEREEKMTGKEFLQRCQLLEDVETSMYQKKENMNPNIRYRYSKDELLKLRNHPLSLKPPTLQENLKHLLGSAKPKDRDEADLKKNQLKKHGVMRNLDGNEKFEVKKNEISRNDDKLANNRNEPVDETRKFADPKERIRKEQDICLSPQRKSFNTGCFVKAEAIAININNNNNNNSNNNINNKNSETGGREIRENRENRDNRDIKKRIGSGRIISRDPRLEIRGYPESPAPYISRQYPVKEIPTVIYERKFPVNNPFDKDKNNKVWDRQRKYDGPKRRSYNHEEEEEPEWMNEPLSKDVGWQGFDKHIPSDMRNPKGNSRVFHKSFNNSYTKSAQNGRNRTDKRNSDSDNSSVASDSLTSKTNENNAQIKQSGDRKIDDTGKEKVSEKNEKKDDNDSKNAETNSIQFNLEEILKLDLVPDISGNTDNESAGSKFTRWFKRDEAHSANASNGEQIPGVSKDSLIFNSSHFPTNVSEDFAKAQNIGENVNPHSSINHSVPASNLLDLLRGSQDNSNAAARAEARSLEAPGKIHSVEEIEAKLRGTDSNSSGGGNAPNDKKKKEEAEAFKKLLSQAFHSEKPSSENNPLDSAFMQKVIRNENMEGKCDSNLATSNVQPQISRLPPSMNSMQQSADMLKLFQMQQQNKQQEMLSKVLMSSNSSANFSVPPPSNVRPPSVVSNTGSLPYITPEIQIMINSVQPTRELMQRADTLNIIRALRSGEVSQYQLVEQLKKTTPYQAKFRESLLCVLRMIQMQSYNPAPVMNAPAGMPFSIPPPPPAQSYSENILQQMMLNSQFRVNGPHNGMPSIVYQREFPSPNQNMYQNNVIKKHLVEQSPNIGQNVARMNSPTTVLPSPVSISVSGNNVTNSTNSVVGSQDDKNNATLSTKSTSSTQSLSFTPTSVLRKLSAEKENLDTLSKEPKESKGGEKNVIIPYISNANNNGSVYANQSAVDHFNGFGTCIPPPAISGQYFVGNMIRPANVSSQVPIFGSPPPPVLSRLPVPSSSTALPRGQPKLTSNASQLQQLHMRNTNSQIAQMIMNSNLNANANRKPTDGNLSISGLGNQNLPSRNAPLNGTLSSAEEQMARWFSSESANQPRNMMAPSMGQTMMSVEEIERVQQSVRN